MKKAVSLVFVFLFLVTATAFAQKDKMTVDEIVKRHLASSDLQKRSLLLNLVSLSERGL